MMRHELERAATAARRCCLCHERHGLTHCPIFRDLAPAQRARIVATHGCCANCLAMSHTHAECESAGRCGTCGATHHTWLHVPTALERQQQQQRRQQQQQQQQPQQQQQQQERQRLRPPLGATRHTRRARRGRQQPFPAYSGNF